MKYLRPILLAIIVVSAFYLVTNRAGRAPGTAASSDSAAVTRPEHVELAEASGPQPLDSEEQLNVTVYKKALPSVVNITSTAVAFDFFYGPVPQQGAGSGFVTPTPRTARSMGCLADLAGRSARDEGMSCPPVAAE